MGSVPDAAHDEEEVLGFLVGHRIEGVGDPDLVAEVGPAVQCSSFGLPSPGGDGTAGCFETSAEITSEAVEDGR